MVVVPAKKILSIGKIVAIFFIVLIIALGVAIPCWIASHTKVEKTAESHKHQVVLIQEEALLGKSKQEVYNLIGYPYSYKRWGQGESFPDNMDAWGEKVHVWTYTSNDEETEVMLYLYFSDDGKVEFIEIIWENFETQKVWIEEQGIESKYY
jgi:small-conductance mechanosensitive channel